MDETILGQNPPVEPTTQVSQGEANDVAAQRQEATAPTESVMERWDQLDEEIAKFREQSDERVQKLLQGVDAWVNSQVPNWGLEERKTSETNYVYIEKDEQGNSKQYIVEFHGPPGGMIGLGVDEISPENQDPKAVEVIDTGYGPNRYIVNWHKIDGTTLYRYNAHWLDNIDRMKDYGFIVARRLRGDEIGNIHDPQLAPNAYGQLYGSRKLIRNRPEEEERRVDPIIEGEKTLKRLQSAQFLGRFDEETGQVVAPNSPLTG